MIVQSLRTKGWQGKYLYGLNSAVIEKETLIAYKQSLCCDMTNMNGKQHRSPGLFSFGLAYPRHYLPFPWESSLAWKNNNFSLCPLCEVNDVIYDYKGGNVLRGTWRKPTEDKIIKQDIGNTVRRNPYVSEQETGQPLKDYLWCPTVEERPHLKWWEMNRLAVFSGAVFVIVFLQEAVNYLQSNTSQACHSMQGAQDYTEMSWMLKGFFLVHFAAIVDHKLNLNLYPSICVFPSRNVWRHIKIPRF